MTNENTKLNRMKKSAAELSIISNVVLTILKIIAGIITGSLSILSEAIHSMSDFLASIITYFSVIKSSKPADYDHPYGHGKYEDMAGFIEGFLIISAAFFIIYKAFKKIIFGMPAETENHIGIIVMAVAVVANFIISSILIKVSKKSGSVSLYADGEHLRTDVYSSLGVLIGLVLIKITGHSVLDPLIAILVAVFILRTGFSITKKTLNCLLDSSLPDSDIEKIKAIINNFSNNVTLKENGIKARQMGPNKDIDIILQLDGNTTICECHKICDKIEEEIQKLFLNSSISIHTEPICYGKNCQHNCRKL